jgi:hypothetical protein
MIQGNKHSFFIKHFLNTALNRGIQHNQSILHGDFDFTGSQIGISPCLNFNSLLDGNIIHLESALGSQSPPSP